MLSIEIGYPELDYEIRIVTETTGTSKPDIEPTISCEDSLRIQQGVRAMPVSQDVIRYAVKLATATRPGTPGCPKGLDELMRWGAGPRASQYLILGAKGRAAMLGRPCADFEGVRSVLTQVLSHRVLPSFKARTQGISTAEIIRRISESVSEKS